MVSLARHFLYLAWLQETWQAHSQATVHLHPQGRRLKLTSQQCSVALLMNYLGSFSLRELSVLAKVDRVLLEEWRESPEFLWMMDWSKSRFAKNFQEILSLEDFSWPAYQEIAGEFACLEESLRIRVRTGLYPKLRDLGERFLSQYHHGLSLETFSFPRFRRLFLFFWALEAFWPSPARLRLRDRLLPLALELVWPALGLRDGEELIMEPCEAPQIVQHLKEFLSTEISKVFQECERFSNPPVQNLSRGCT